MALAGKVIDFIRLSLGNNAPHRAVILKAGGVKKDTAIVNLWIVVEVSDSRMLKNGRRPDDAVDFVAFVEQELREVGPILPSDACDQRSRHASGGDFDAPFLVGLEQLDISLDHDPDQLLEGSAGLPFQLAPGFAGVSDKQVHFGGPQ